MVRKLEGVVVDIEKEKLNRRKKRLAKKRSELVISNIEFRPRMAFKDDKNLIMPSDTKRSTPIAPEFILVAAKKRKHTNKDIYKYPHYIGIYNMIKNELTIVIKDTAKSGLRLLKHIRKVADHKREFASYVTKTKNKGSILGIQVVDTFPTWIRRKLLKMGE